MNDNEKELAESFFQDAKGDIGDKLRSLFDQMWFVAPLFRTVENQAAAGGKVYAFYFTARNGHGNELPTVFNHPEMTADMGRAFDETFSRTMRKMWTKFAKTGDPSLGADLSPDGREKVWPVYNPENKRVMVFDEFNIHPEKESERKIVDWDRTYFLTKYFWV